MSRIKLIKFDRKQRGSKSFNFLNYSDDKFTDNMDNDLNILIPSKLNFELR